MTKTTTQKPSSPKAKTPDFWDHIEAAVATTKPKRRSAVDEKPRSIRGSNVFWARIRAAMSEVQPAIRREIARDMIVRMAEELPAWEAGRPEKKAPAAAKAPAKAPAKAAVKPSGGKAPSPAPKAKTPAAKAAAARSKAFRVEIMDSDRV